MNYKVACISNFVLAALVYISTGGSPLWAIFGLQGLVYLLLGLRKS